MRNYCRETCKTSHTDDKHYAGRENRSNNFQHIRTIWHLGVSQNWKEIWCKRVITATFAYSRYFTLLLDKSNPVVSLNLLSLCAILMRKGGRQVFMRLSPKTHTTKVEPPPPGIEWLFCELWQKLRNAC